MKYYKNITLFTLLIGLLLFSCEEDEICTTCTYIHPANGSNVETQECLLSSELDIWEEDFKAQVRALGGEWDSLEITCVR